MTHSDRDQYERERDTNRDTYRYEISDLVEWKRERETNRDMGIYERERKRPKKIWADTRKRETKIDIGR